MVSSAAEPQIKRASIQKNGVAIAPQIQRARRFSVTYDPSVGDVIRKERKFFELWVLLQRKGERSGLHQ